MKRLRVGLLLVIAAIAIQSAWYAALMTAYVRTPGKLGGRTS
jgi:hypothetical protein